MRTLVTGGAGFIGTHLCTELIARDIEVCVFDDFSTGRWENVERLDATVFMGSVTDIRALRRATAGADAVVHLAAVASVPQSIELPVRTHQVNVNGTLNVLQCAREVGAHVTVASSAAIYGNAAGMVTAARNLPQPLSPYATSKLAAESYATSWQACYGLETLALRFFNVFGPGQRPGDAYAAVIPAFLSAAVSGQPLHIHGDGTQTRDFIPVQVVAGLLADAVESRIVSRSPIDVAYGRRTSLLSLIDIIEEIVRQPLRRVFVPSRPGDIRDSAADGAAMRALFPRLRQIGLREALKETLSWWETTQPRLPA